MISIAALNLCNWIITKIYIEVSVETAALLNKEVYCNNQETIDEVIRIKRRLRIADYFVWAFTLVIAILTAVGYSVKKLYLTFIATYARLLFQTGCMLVWGSFLYKLYKMVKKSELLPNKNIFILHGSLLIAYLVFSFIG